MSCLAVLKPGVEVIKKVSKVVLLILCVIVKCCIHTYCVVSIYIDAILYEVAL